MHSEGEVAADMGRGEFDLVSVAPSVLSKANWLNKRLYLLRAEFSDALETGDEVLDLGGVLSFGG